VATAAVTYEADRGRVLVEVDAIEAGVVHVSVARKTVRPMPDGTAYTHANDWIRGGWRKSVASTTALRFYDYEADPAPEAGPTNWCSVYTVHLSTDPALTTTSQLAGQTVWPVLTVGGWLKSVARPYLNLPVTVQDFGPLTRTARQGLFPVVGRTLPVAVTDTRLGIECELRVLTDTLEQRDTLDALLASGDVVYVEAPPLQGMPWPMHTVVGTYAEARMRFRPHPRRLWTLALQQVAAPDPLVVVGVERTYLSVRDAYASYQDLKDSNESYLALLEGDAPPTEVIVP